MSLVELKDINLVFKVRRDKRIKDFLIPGSNRFDEVSEGKWVHALKDINLTVRDGDRLAIIGHNGAGKSTLLRVISDIYAPTSGEMKIDGRISGMFEFATGFEMEQSGWDNIYLRGLMLGETPDEIIKKMSDIAAFSELGEFLNMPVKYYSSGMLIRLAFSVSTAISPDILLLDEAMAAGDAAFIEKANNRMKEMMNISKILIFVTHSMASAVELCNRCIWMERGAIVQQGDPREVTEAYMQSMVEKTEK